MKLWRYLQDARDDLMCWFLGHMDEEMEIGVHTPTGEILPDSIVEFGCSRCYRVLRQEEWALVPAWVRADLSSVSFLEENHHDVTRGEE